MKTHLLKLLLVILVLFNKQAFSQAGKNGDAIISNTQFVNEYTSLSQDANAGAQAITVNNSAMMNSGVFNYPLEPGDLVMIIQMQGATILGNVNDPSWGQVLNYNNCGLYEFKEVAAVPNATQISLTCPLENSYTESGNVQIIRVPRYNSLLINGGSITSPAWDGQIGGIVAIEVLGQTTFLNGGNIDVTGTGFRGGLKDNSAGYNMSGYAYNAQNAGGEKGEGIAGFGPEYANMGGEHGRGAPANGGGGGNAHNAGGGGGANAGAEIPWNGQGNPDNSNPNWTTAWNLEAPGFSNNQSSGGGRGGYTYSGANLNALVNGPGNANWNGDWRQNHGGLGGRPLDYSTGRLFMGGGGGAGDGNNGAGTDGAYGGGMVYLLTLGDVIGTGQIIASGQTAPVTPPNGNDAPGGGGGGGTIVINTTGTVSAGISLIANGGDGGDQAIATNEAEGPGGGGGGGFIAYSAGNPATSVLGGANGTTNSLAMTEFIPNGATQGGPGAIATGIVNYYANFVSAVDDTVCFGNSTTLTAYATDPAFNNSILWFDAPFDGNLLATGQNFTTPALYANTTYYLKVCPGLYVDSVKVIVDSLPVFTVQTDSVNCFGGSDGVATAVATDNYTYYWSNNQTGPSIDSLSIGNYWVYAATAFGCTDTQTFIIEEPTALNVQFNESQPLCYGDQNGALQAVGSGGTSPYNYYWPNQNFNGATLPNIGAGVYQLQMTDYNGCILNQNGSVTQPQPLSTTLISIDDVDCYAGNDGSAEIMISGGIAPYTTDWLSLPNDSTYMDGLTAGNYVVETYDQNNCLSTAVVTISEPTELTVDINIIAEETCTDANGVAYADAIGGTGLYSYSWTPASGSLPLASGLSAGPLSVMVTDENGCQAIDTDTIIDNPTGTATIGSISPVTCQNGSNGSIQVNMNGGTGPFNYNWSCFCPDTNNVTGLVAGNYWVEVVDDNGCIDTLDFTINELPPLNVNVILLTLPLCNGEANGTAQAGATGGTAPYQYEWSTAPVQYTDYVDNLSAGQYQITVTDSNNCTASINLTMPEPAVLEADVTVLSNNLCFGDSSGVATAAGIGGTQPYSYYWIEPAVANDTVDGLTAGHYTVTVTDANGCEISESVDIIEYDEVTAEMVCDSIFCPGDVVQFNVYTNGMNNLYDYNWSVNGVVFSQSNSFATAIYDTTQINFDLVSQVNCPTISDSAILAPIFLDASVLSVTGTPDTICLGDQATIEAQVSDWSYINAIYWNAPLTGTGPHVVSPNNDYTYVVTLYNICGQEASDSITVNLFYPPEADITALGTTGCDSVNATFNFTYDPYDYYFLDAEWNINGQNYDASNPVIHMDNSALIPAELYLTFSNGCTFSYLEQVPVEVWQSPEANFYYNPDPALQYELTEFIDISHGNPQSWEWYVEGQYISDEERPTYVFEENGEYQVTEIIIDENGCSDTIEHFVEVIGDFTVYIPNAFTPDGEGYNNTFKPVMTNVKEEDYEFLIFNRWGEIIFKANNIDAEWDGQYNGDYVQDGVYVYKILVKDNRDKKHEYMGHVTLLR